jgi:hypothetical protein
LGCALGLSAQQPQEEELMMEMMEYLVMGVMGLVVWPQQQDLCCWSKQVKDAYPYLLAAPHRCHGI